MNAGKIAHRPSIGAPLIERRSLCRGGRRMVRAAAAALDKARAENGAAASMTTSS